MLGRAAQSLNTRSSAVQLQSCRFLRSRWERGYLKDLYHRRELLGADPMLSRSAYPNWNYSAEMYAFGHRINAPEVTQDKLVQALTMPSYFSRSDMEAGASSVLPSHKEELSDDTNDTLLDNGKNRMKSMLTAYLRIHLPDAPEEMIQAISSSISGDTVLAEIAKHIGMDVLIRTAEHPPSSASLASAFRSLIGAMEEKRAWSLLVDMVIPQLIDVDFVDVFPLRQPLAILEDLLKKDGASEVEARLLRSAGETSAQPLFVVGIYKEKKDIIGQSAGESVDIAVDLAAREGLLRLWGLTADKVFFFGDKGAQAPLAEYNKPHWKLSDICSAGVDVSVEVVTSSEQEPLNIVEVAMKYKNDVEAVVGKSYTKRLRHKFSRGSLAKRSFRYLVRPRVYTVA